jgi:hypothetical protein
MNNKLLKLLVAAGGIGLLFITTVAVPDDGLPEFGPWSVPENLGPTVNSAAVEVAACLSKDGLSLYFSSLDRPGGVGGYDIWVSQRPTVDAPWETPQNLGDTINTSSNELTPSLSTDGHRLFFGSNRPGGIGGNDIFVSRRHNKRDDFGWQPAENLDNAVNTADDEQAPMLFEDDATGTITLYFQSNRPGGPGGNDIYASTLQSDEAFGSAVLVAELSSSFQDQQPAIRKDGLEMFLASNRLGTVGSLDLWVSTRPSTSDPWAPPVNLGPVINSVGNDARPALSFNGTVLYFQSARPGNVGGPGVYDLWMTTRTKLRNEQDRDADHGEGGRARQQPKHGRD